MYSNNTVSATAGFTPYVRNNDDGQVVEKTASLKVRTVANHIATHLKAWLETEQFKIQSFPRRAESAYIILDVNANLTLPSMGGEAVLGQVTLLVTSVSYAFRGERGANDSAFHEVLLIWITDVRILDQVRAPTVVAHYVDRLVQVFRDIALITGVFIRLNENYHDDNWNLHTKTLDADVCRQFVFWPVQPTAFPDMKCWTFGTGLGGIDRSWGLNSYKKIVHNRWGLFMFSTASAYERDWCLEELPGVALVGHDPVTERIQLDPVMNLGVIPMSEETQTGDALTMVDERDGVVTYSGLCAYRDAATDSEVSVCAIKIGCSAHEMQWASIASAHGIGVKVFDWTTVNAGVKMSRVLICDHLTFSMNTLLSNYFEHQEADWCTVEQAHNLYATVAGLLRIGEQGLLHDAINIANFGLVSADSHLPLQWKVNGFGQCVPVQTALRVNSRMRSFVARVHAAAGTVNSRGMMRVCDKLSRVWDTVNVLHSICSSIVGPNGFTPSHEHIQLVVFVQELGRLVYNSVANEFSGFAQRHPFNPYTVLYDLQTYLSGQDAYRS